MKILSIFIIAFFVTLATSSFVPVPDFDLNQLAGEWNVQSIYDSTSNDWSLAYCFTMSFDILNDSTVNQSLTFVDGFGNDLRQDSVLLYPDAENPAILYQDAAHSLAPLLILNYSSQPYWANNETDVIIWAFNYTTEGGNPQYIIMGASRWYDTEYDIRPLLTEYNIPINYTKNFWFINSACDTHWGWTPFGFFNSSSLLNTWNLVAVYEPAGSGLVPWYTEGGLFDWEQAYCAKVSFTAGKEFDDLMTLSLNSLYQGTFERTWQILPAPGTESVLLGFNIDANTLLYVSYSDLLGNLILTAGTTTSFFLSTKTTTLTLAQKELFESELAAMGYVFDVNLIVPIDNSSC